MAASTSKNMPGDGDGGFRLKVVFVSFNDDDDDDDKGARLCGDAMMMRGQRKKEMTHTVNVWSSRSSVVSSICSVLNSPKGDAGRSILLLRHPRRRR